jgi:hypothetical protein
MPDINFDRFNERLRAVEQVFAKVNGGYWTNDQDVPYWLAIRINPARLVLDPVTRGRHCADVSG